MLFNIFLFLIGNIKMQHFGNTKKWKSWLNLFKIIQTLSHIFYLPCLENGWTFGILWNFIIKTGLAVVYIFKKNKNSYGLFKYLITIRFFWSAVILNIVYKIFAWCKHVKIFILRDWRFCLIGSQFRYCL